MRVSLIGYLPSNFNIEIICKDICYPLNSWLSTLRTLDKIITLSLSCEIFLRAHAIDATYIANPIKNTDRRLPAIKYAEIIVIARLDDPLKQISHALLIMSRIKKKLPYARMIFVGDFNLDDARRQFYARVEQHQLQNYVRITGWTADPFYYIDRAKVLLSTSFIEGFPNGIAEAQVRGVPVVMYNLDIMMARNNPSIIRVPQGDVVSAANEIIDLLSHEDLWMKLSRQALKYSSWFSDDIYSHSIIDFMENYDNRSYVKPYSNIDYQRIIRDIAFYAGKGFPNSVSDENECEIDKWFGYSNECY